MLHRAHPSDQLKARQGSRVGQRVALAGLLLLGLALLAGCGGTTNATYSPLAGGAQHSAAGGNTSSASSASSGSNAQYGPNVPSSPQATPQATTQYLIKALNVGMAMPDTRATANALHPGLIPSTGLFRALPPPLPAALRLVARLPAGPFVTNISEGARTSVFLAASSEVAGVSGEYFARCHVAASSRAARDAERAGLLWQASARLTGLAESEIGV